MNGNTREPVKQERFALPAIEAMLVAAFGLAKGDAPDIRWRIKQMQRHDWPDTVVTDPDLRKGYTPRQALRILTASALLDAGYGPTEAIRLARENENTALAVMATGLPGSDPGARLHAVHRPGAVGPGTARLTEPSPLELRPLAPADIAPMLVSEGRGRGLVSVDLAGMAGRAVRALCGASTRSLAAFETLVTAGVHATARGDGYIASDHPTGDRYLSPRRRSGAAGSG